MSRAAVLALALVGATLAAPIASAAQVDVSDPVGVTALAVAETEEGGVEGVASNVSVSVARDGSGHVFIDTRPLATTDVQGSARIAARVAASVTGYEMEDHDFFFVVRSESPVIAGPSAGAVLSAAAVAALENAHAGPGQEPTTVDDGVMGTGTINPDGTIGPVGGILEKAEAASDRGAELFLVPEGQGEYRPRLAQTRERVGPGPVNVSSYCDEELGIECREVGTIEAYVEAATGLSFEEPELGEPPDTARYADTLSPLARRLVDDVDVPATRERLNRTDTSNQAREVALDQLSKAQESLDRARTALDDERFYSAASRAFQASVHDRRARYVLDLKGTEDPRAFIEETIDRAAGNVSQARDRVAGAQPTGVQTLYTVGAAQERLTQAEDRLDQARQRLNATDARGALFAAAFVVERAETVAWWLDVGDQLGPGPALTRSPADLSGELVDLASERIAYTSSVVGSRGQLLQAASEHLEQAERAEDRGLHGAALLEAAQAQVLATLPLEVRQGEPSSQAINTTEAEAAEAIRRARGQGVEPILPIATFELATSEEGIAKMRLLRTARVLAGIPGMLTGDGDAASSPFVEGELPSGGPAAPTGDTGDDRDGGERAGEQRGAPAGGPVAAALAAALGALAAARTRER